MSFAACPTSSLPTNAVIFDLDGTLVDSWPGIECAVSAAWDAVLPGSPCPSFRRLTGPPIREMFHQALPSADTATLTALERAFRTAYDSQGWQKTVTYPGVRETLAALTADGVRCFGATNKPSLPTQKILERCGLSAYFEVFLSPDSRTPPYTSKVEAVATLLGQYELDPARTLLMGDAGDDARAAQACGLRFVGFTGGYGWPPLQDGVKIALCTEFAHLLKLVRSERM